MIPAIHQKERAKTGSADAHEEQRKTCRPCAGQSQPPSAT